MLQNHQIISKRQKMESLRPGTNPAAPRAACRKCGFPGHLTFQCRNTISATQKPAMIESTSSESEYETPLQQLRRTEVNLANSERVKESYQSVDKKKKTKKKRKRSHSASSSASSPETVQKPKKESSKKKKRKHVSSSESDDERKYKKVKKSQKKRKPKKKKKHSSSSDNSS